MLIILKNKWNLGYSKTLNKAAKSARGEYLAFLHNDTEVKEGWLKHLVTVMEGNP